MSFLSWILAALNIDAETNLWIMWISCWEWDGLKYSAPTSDLGSLRMCLKDPTVENANSLPAVSLAGLRNVTRTSRTDYVGSGFGSESMWGCCGSSLAESHSSGLSTCTPYSVYLRAFRT